MKARNLGICGVFFLFAIVSAAVAQPRLTPELIKKYDKNGDGKLDEQERAAARAAVRGKDAKPGAARLPAGATGKPATALVPLTEVTGENGGLYGNGRNEPPEAWQVIARKETARIVPLDESGKPSPDGKIVLLAIGMSNTTYEYADFQAAMKRDKEKSPNVVLVDAAQSGKGAVEWTDADSEKIWSRATRQVKDAGAANPQVQAVWLKQAIKVPLPDSRENAKVLQGHLQTIVTRAKSQFPNLRVVYLSSRTYGGYSAKHGEPESYDTAFAVRGLIQDQMAGKAELNFDERQGKVKAPLLLWGPYLWANGETPRASDKLVWQRSDFIADGTHPSASGRAKVVDQLTRFCKTDPLAKTWFLK